MTGSDLLLSSWRKSSRSGEQGGMCIEVAAAWRKSSHSGPQGGECIEVSAAWRKSPRSGEQGGECVEIASGEQMILARDSKDPGGAVLSFSRAEWAAFTRAVKQAS